MESWRDVLVYVAAELLVNQIENPNSPDEHTKVAKIALGKTKSGKKLPEVGTVAKQVARIL